MDNQAALSIAALAFVGLGWWWPAGLACLLLLIDIAVDLRR